MWTSHLHLGGSSEGAFEKGFTKQKNGLGLKRSDAIILGVCDVMVRISPVHPEALFHGRKKPRGPGMYSSFKKGLVSQLGLLVFVLAY